MCLFSRAILLKSWLKGQAEGEKGGQAVPASPRLHHNPPSHETPAAGDGRRQWVLSCPANVMRAGQWVKPL